MYFLAVLEVSEFSIERMAGRWLGAACLEGQVSPQGLHLCDGAVLGTAEGQVWPVGHAGNAREGMGKG